MNRSSSAIELGALIETLAQVRRRTLLGLSLSGMVPAVLAQEAYPSKVIKIIVPFAAGGGTDVLGRLFAQRVSVPLGKSVIIENNGGAGGTIGCSQVVRAKPDGYTFLLTSLAPITIAPNLPGMKPGYEPGKDLVPVAMLAQRKRAVIPPLKGWA